MDFRQMKIKKKYKIKSKLAQKLYDDNIWHVNMTKSIIFKFFMHLTSFVFVILANF